MIIWTGKEMEGKYKGVETMFVKTEELDDSKVERILAVLQLHPEVNAIYLGAGRTDIKQLDPKVLNWLAGYCKYRKIMISLETTDLQSILNNPAFFPIIRQANIQIIHRLDAAFGVFSITDNIINKIDDTQKIELSPFTPKYTVDVTSVKEGMYTGIDKVVYADDTN